MKRAQLEAARKPVPGLFAGDPAADMAFVGGLRSGFAFHSGIPAMYMSRSGKKVVRADVNGIGRLVSQSRWFDQLGGYWTFDRRVAEAIGGYPQGAILRWRDPVTGAVRAVRSLVPDNMADFTEDPGLIDDENWAFVDEVVPATFRPRVFPDFSSCREGELAQNAELVLDTDCMISIQTGSDADITTDGSDFSLFLAVRRSGETEYHTAALLCYLPASAALLSQGILSDQGWPEASSVLNRAFHAYNAPSPIQMYFNAGDTLKLVKSRDYDFSESYKFHCFPLVAAGMSAHVVGAGAAIGAGAMPVYSGSGSSDPVVTISVSHALVNVVDLSSDIQLADQTTHCISAPASTAALTFVMPQHVQGEAHEFEVVLTLPSPLEDPPALTFNPYGSDTLSLLPVGGNGTALQPASGVNVYKFREVGEGVFSVSRTTVSL